MGFREVSVRIAKNASYTGTTFLAYTHPLIALPAYPRARAIRRRPAWPATLIRQETEFDPDATSAMRGARWTDADHAGPRARGRTAAEAPASPIRPNDLTFDPSYNIQLNMTEFTGRCRLLWRFLRAGRWPRATIYRARGNVKKWLAANGDPRLRRASIRSTGSRMIPFNETRNYVQRALENAQIYRGKLAGRDLQTRLLNDPVRAERRVRAEVKVIGGAEPRERADASQARLRARTSA